MGQALYRKYRSRSFDEVVGQDHIINTLQAAIKSGRISHAYLFTGPRGVGKTSVARILAHEINGLDYSGEETHLDIIEIDAASNRRIDEIRELRDKVHITPTSAKYKVYIIDEVHMLTREAFNALLKTLEEPPEHVVFILATTEGHKLPETIVSRTQRYNFKPVSAEVAYTHLLEMAKKEKIKVDEPALRLLAEFGDGSFRDSISLLDQLGSSGSAVSEAAVREQLGLPESEIIKQLLATVASGDNQAVLALIDKLRYQAADAANTAKLLAQSIREDISKGAIQPFYTELLKSLLDVSASSKPFDSLEIALFEAAADSKSDTPEPQAKQPEPTPEPTAKEVEEAPAPEVEKIEVEVRATDGNFDIAMWDDVLAAVKQQAASLYTALRLAVPEVDGKGLTLAFEFPLHQKKVDSTRHKELVAGAIEKICGAKMNVTCVVDKDLVRSKSNTPAASLYVPAEPVDQDELQTINNIFGSAEVLES